MPVLVANTPFTNVRRDVETVLIADISIQTTSDAVPASLQAASRNAPFRFAIHESILVLRSMMQLCGQELVWKGIGIGYPTYHTNKSRPAPGTVAAVPVPWSFSRQGTRDISAIASSKAVGSTWKSPRNGWLRLQTMNNVSASIVVRPAVINACGRMLRTPKK